jgi:hypothetical protein
MCIYLVADRSRNGGATTTTKTGEVLVFRGLNIAYSRANGHTEQCSHFTRGKMIIQAPVYSANGLVKFSLARKSNYHESSRE